MRMEMEWIWREKRWGEGVVGAPSPLAGPGGDGRLCRRLRVCAPPLHPVPRCTAALAGATPQKNGARGSGERERERGSSHPPSPSPQLRAPASRPTACPSSLRARCPRRRRFAGPRRVALSIPSFLPPSAPPPLLSSLISLSLPQVVVKAQILAGGRGLGTFTNGLQGGVHIVPAADAPALAARMLGGTLVTKQSGPAGKPVGTLLIARKMALAREMYLAILLDRKAAGPVVVACSEGMERRERVRRGKPATPAAAVPSASGGGGPNARRAPPLSRRFLPTSFEGRGASLSLHRLSLIPHSLRESGSRRGKGTPRHAHTPAVPRSARPFPAPQALEKTLAS